MLLYSQYKTKLSTSSFRFLSQIGKHYMLDVTLISFKSFDNDVAYLLNSRFPRVRNDMLYSTIL